jgi:flagellar motor component MotA
MTVKDGKGVVLAKWGAVLLVVVSFVYGCTNSKKEVTSTVQNLLKAAYEKNSDQVRKYVDFDAMLDRSMKEQGMSSIDANRRKNIIDGLVQSTCQLSKDDYDRAIKTMKVEVGPNGDIADAVYSTLDRTDIRLTLGKRKTGWVVTAIE